MNTTSPAVPGAKDFASFAAIYHALNECAPELRESALELLGQLAGGDLDEYETHATTALIAEILYPNADQHGVAGLDLVEAEQIARREFPEHAPELDELDREEATFAERLGGVMQQKGVTQADLAAKIGVGQPAISMMLARACRPQRKTVQKLADALGVAPADLWPGE